MLRFPICFFLGLTACVGLARAAEIIGTVTDAGANRSVEFVAVTLKQTDGTMVQSTVTDARGKFTLEKVLPGDYTVAYNLVGADGRTSARFSVVAESARLDLGRLSLGEPVVKMEKFEVQAKPVALLNAIDRKVYRVGQEIQSATGSASDLLQNIPSVQVDIDGNVSLRGSDNVMILVNGRTSTLMGRSRAEVLQQLPADSIEKIEVITNPSAKYKPDGTAGIINIVLKQKREGRFSAVANAAVGTNDRYNAGASINYNAGAVGLFGSASVRQDDRERRGSDVRTIVDPATGATIRAEKTTLEHSRPLSRLVRAGAEYSVDDHNKVGLTGNFNRRTFERHATDYNVVRDGRGTITAEFDRTRLDPEFEESHEGKATWQHKFADEDHELNFEFKSSSTRELEDNRYTNVFRAPMQSPTRDNTLIKNANRGQESVVEYTRPLGDEAKFEAGYTVTSDRLDQDFGVARFNAGTGQFVTDVTQSNRFALASDIHAFYATYGRTFGKFGLLAGLRPEIATVTSHLLNTGVTVPNDYTRIYPSLHLSYHLTDKHEFQLNYSHRVHRPEADELNPFPEYADPFNLRAGNPKLLPEDIHSVEAGYSFKQDDTSLTSTIYHRYLYHGFTTITRSLGGGVLLTTRENLSESRSTGLELTANTELGKIASLNFSSNTFFNTIDASNLGFSTRKSDVSWTAKLGASFRLPKATLIQFNTNYTSSRLTPQGSRRPTFVGNLSVRHDLLQKKAAVVLTISDLFNSLKESSRLDTPLLKQEIVRRRSARIVYLGFIYNFGKPVKKEKDDALKFDNAL